MDKKLVIITGVNGKLGEAYLDYFASKDNFDVVSLSRSEQKKDTAIFKSIYLDLLDQAKVATEVEMIDFSIYEEIFLVHPVGKFKFQKENKLESDKDEIDAEIYTSNVVTLENILIPLISFTKRLKTRLYICAFGSISDRYGIPFWSSYSESKNILRAVLKNLANQAGLGLKINVLFVNVSSVDTGNENKLRPNADKRFWLKPEKIVAESVSILLSRFTGYKEIDIYNAIPDFDTNYYHNNKKILQKWLKEME